MGPSTVLDRVEPVDYIIATPERRKSKRLVLVNMLKAYVSRSDSVCPVWCINENNCGKCDRLMPKILCGCENYARYYLDEIIVFTSSSLEEHLDHIRDVFRRTRDAGVKLNKDKYQIGSGILEFLAHKIGMGRVEPSGLRVMVMLDFPRPSDWKQVQSFLGITGYFRRYIPTYGNIPSVSSELLKKGKIFQWSKECKKAFLDLKSCLAFRPVLLDSLTTNFLLTL